ncbi:hypothetical protein F7725_021352 [Dissostichus mawsoni]|uniref:Uncharacterized protein n=1 Tax=Dissostichus mawsoni TaxID=36200 RepID=A0A7J5ZBK2_DISMA|nr:hypothetical protein F7725_021352 [Dissostichus mawsoni]
MCSWVIPQQPLCRKDVTRMDKITFYCRSGMREHGGCSDSSATWMRSFRCLTSCSPVDTPTQLPRAAQITHTHMGTYSGTADVMMISSDSDDDAPYVPLAQRLKQRQESVINATSVTNGKDVEHYSPSKLGDLQLSRQNGLSEQPLSFHQVRTVSPDEAAVFPQQGLPPADTKKNAAKQTLELQSSRKEVLMKKQNREGHQRAKEGTGRNRRGREPRGKLWLRLQRL